MDTRSSLGSGVGTCKLGGGLGAGWGCLRSDVVMTGYGFGVVFGAIWCSDLDWVANTDKERIRLIFLQVPQVLVRYHLH
eukprot:gene26274-biopygen15471